MSAATAPTHAPSRVRGVVVTVGGFVVLGVVVGWLWSVLADPATYTVDRDGALMGETEAAKQFGVAVTFAWLSGLATVLWGAFCAWRYASLGWPHVVVTLLGATAASALAWRLGLILGPPDPAPIVKTAEVGARVPTRLEIESYGVLLVWPVGALAGLLAAVTWLLPPDSAERDPQDT